MSLSLKPVNIIIIIIIIRITVSEQHLLPKIMTKCRVDDRRICFVSELCVLDCVVLLVGCSGNVSWSVRECGYGIVIVGKSVKGQMLLLTTLGQWSNGHKKNANVKNY